MAAAVVAVGFCCFLAYVILDLVFLAVIVSCDVAFVLVC